MSVPTDADARRDFRLAARLMMALAAGFFTIGGVAVAVAMPDESPSSASLASATQREVAAADPASATSDVERTEAVVPADADVNAPLVVEVTMGEFFFAPQRITVPAGRVIQFDVTNPGAVPHEFLVGDRHVQDDAEKQMRKGGTTTASHSHDDSVSLYLEAGASGVLEATFDTPAELLIGCHVPGHWAAGMQGTLTVTPT